MYLHAQWVRWTLRTWPCWIIRHRFFPLSSLKSPTNALLLSKMVTFFHFLLLFPWSLVLGVDFFFSFSAARIIFKGYLFWDMHVEFLFGGNFLLFDLINDLITIVKTLWFSWEMYWLCDEGKSWFGRSRVSIMGIRVCNPHASKRTPTKNIKHWWFAVMD